MSDAEKAVRCEYRHEWVKSHGEHPIPRVYYECSKCGYKPNEDSMPWHEAESILHLREVLKPGDTVYTVLRHVSRSGMSRNIDVYYMAGSEPRWISAYVGHAIGTPQSRKNWERSQGLTVGGCGMDMGFHVVNSLSKSVFPEYKCLGKDANPRCPSNYHRNHHDTVQCEGTMVWNNEGPNTGDRCQWEQGKGWVIDGKTCPKCKGKGRLPNPEGPERWDLMHTDGYALNHKWL